MFALAGVGALIVWRARKSMPESPRWLESKGRLEEADQTMSRIEAEVGMPPCVRPAPSAPQSPPAKPVRLGVIFTAPVIRRTLIGCLTTVTANVVLYGFLSWLPTFLVTERMGLSSSLKYTMLMSFGAPFGPLLGALFADRIGRRAGLAASSVLAAVIAGAYALAPSMAAMTVAGFFLYMTTYLVATLGMVSYVPELFPTEYRLRGAGFCIGIGRMSAMLTPYAVVWAYSRGGVNLILVMLESLLLVQAAIVAAFGISTEQRSLEDLSPEAGRKAKHSERDASATVAVSRTYRKPRSF